MKASSRIVLIGVVFLTASGIVYEVFSQKKHRQQAVASANNCRPELWSHVYKPKRLRVQDECIRVSGYITFKKEEEDGDLHMRLDLDEPFRYLVNDANIRDQSGCLVVEAVCACRVKEEEAKAACEGYSNTVFIPHKGAHVWVTGSYILDKHNGWMEIHPVSDIQPF